MDGVESSDLLGALGGLVYGFVDGFICGWVFGWLYNRIAAPKRSAGAS
jgi:hypothetical protein